MPHMSRATLTQLAHATKIVGAALGADRATYCFGGRLAVALPADGWSLAISADDAERLRLEACRDGRVVATMWSVAGNDDRLAELAFAFRDEAAVLA